MGNGRQRKDTKVAFNLTAITGRFVGNVSHFTFTDHVDLEILRSSHF